MTLLISCFGLMGSLAHAQSSDAGRSLLRAAREGDLGGVRSALDQGADVNETTKYGATALSYASDRGHLEIVKVLIERGADVNIKDKFYSATPLDWAIGNKHTEVVGLLAQAGATELDSALQNAVALGQSELAKAIIANGKLSDEELTEAIKLAVSLKQNEIVSLLEKEGIDASTLQEFKIDPSELHQYEGKFRTDAGFQVTFIVEDGQLKSKVGSGSPVALVPTEKHKFRFANSSVTFELTGETVSKVTWSSGGQDTVLTRADASESDQPAKDNGQPAETEFPPSSASSQAADLAISSPNWPRFRGNMGRGVADGQSPPVAWNVEKNENVLWTKEIPGLGNSCPVIFDDRLFLTTAESKDDQDGLKPGLYGDVGSVDDKSLHTFTVFCLNKHSGATEWQQIATTAIPQGKRHPKSTHANSTPATNGRFVVAFFGSEGLYCYACDDGKLIWSKDLGLLDSGWFYDRDYQWGFGSSPIIFESTVIVQCDVQDQSFIAAYDLETGSEIWRQNRETIPSWSTPTIVEAPDGPLVVTNATEAAIAYDARTGAERWRLGPNSEIVVPTPFSAHGLIYLASGYRPIQPIYAVRDTAKGDISLPDDQTSSDEVAWSESRSGPYMPSPICYGDYLYVCSNSGVLACYQARTGKQVYRKRLATTSSSSFTGSPVAADGRIYFPSESGEVFVIAAGPNFQKLSTNPAGESVLATPAISAGALYLRTERQMMAFSENK